MHPHRATLRLVLPPIAAVGILALLVGPSVAGADQDPPAPRTAAVTSAQQLSASTTRNAPRPDAGGHTVVVGIPAVAFTETVVAVDGHLRTPVLLADPTVKARARVIGARTGRGCTAVLSQGVPAWLDCTVRVQGRTAARILVTLSDGRSVQKEILAT